MANLLTSAVLVVLILAAGLVGILVHSLAVALLVYCTLCVTAAALAVWMILR